MKIFIDNKLQICDKSFNRTPQGYLQLEGIISRSGTQTYLDAELGVGNAGKMIELDRPVQEVTDSLSIASFINMPITDEHPAGGQVNPDNFSQLVKGTVLDAESTPSGQVKARIIVNDASLIRKIEDGKRELSAGYTAELEFSDDGNSAIQRKIRGNHVAFVDAARCGKECSIFDSEPNTGDPTMAKIKLNNVEYEMADSIVPAVQAVLDENATLQTQVTDSKAELDKVTALFDAAKEKMSKMEDEEDPEKMKKTVNDAAHAILAVMTDAATLISDYDATGKTIEEIKRDVVCDSKPELADKGDAYIEARFDIMVADAAAKDPITDAFKHNMNDSNVNITDSEVARKASIERKQNAWKTPAQKAGV